MPLAPLRKNEVREHPTTNRVTEIDWTQFDLTGVRVLLVDDEEDARNLLARALEGCGVKVYSAADAGEGLDRIREHRPDIVISDIGMPMVDGYEFLRRIRNLPPEEGGRTPAIALTAFARTEDRTRAMLAGFQVHIAKPIETPELLATVSSLAGRTT